MPFTHFYSDSLAQELARAAVRREAATAAGSGGDDAIAPSWVPVTHYYYYSAGSRAGARCGAARGCCSREGSGGADAVAPSWVPQLLTSTTTSLASILVCAAVRREATAAARRAAVLTPPLHRTWVPFTHFYSNSLARELAHAPRCGARLLRQPRAAALTPSLHRGYQSPTATATALASMLARAALQR